MPERPLLIFSKPGVADKTTSPRFSPNKPHYPNAARQWERLSPKFAQLQNALVQVQPNADGIEPESVLVIETIGAVEDFVNAVKRISGFEWLGEMDEDGITPDDDFYNDGHHEKPLTGRLYWVLTNQEALQSILSLWKRYKEDVDNYPDKDMRKQRDKIIFNGGLAKFRDIFLQLKDIRRWDVQDRLEETGVLSVWREELKDTQSANMTVSCEIELWFRSDPSKRDAAQQNVTSRIQQAGGQIVSQAVIPKIAYHALLATLSRNEIQNILDGNREASYLQCENVQFFRPCGQMVFGKEQTTDKLETTAVNANLPLPTGQPTIALFDGLPLENHTLLSGRLTVDDPDEYGADYAAAARKHGTAMASLIVQGDLNDGQSPLQRPLYVRPIMRPKQDFDGNWKEYIPENVLFTDLLHRSVRRLFESENEQLPAAPSVKIINLSIGDPARQFMNAMSPAAKLLDWLSEKYKVLFIVSAGNHQPATSRIALRLNQTWRQLSALSADEREAEIVKALYSDMRNRLLLSPAETINGLTIGALHYDSSTPISTDNRVDLFSHTFLPSPVSAFGGGYHRAVKPDLLFSGGRQLYEKPVLQNTPAEFRYSGITTIAPGNQAATPNISGQLNNTSFSRGTSNAAALISRSAGICYDSLLQLLEDQPNEVVLNNCEVPLLKAMIIHGCSWGEAKNRLEDIFSGAGIDGKKAASRWLGYGVPDIQRVLECTQQRATVLGFGELLDGQAHLFRFPLPPSLGEQRIKRRLTVTLSWLSRIVPSTQKYRESSLWFEVLDNSLSPSRSENDWQAVRRGTVQHEIFVGERALPINEGDSLQIKVNCRNDAAKITQPVAYGLVVSLEVAEGQETDIAIYDEIRARIMIPIQTKVVT